MQHALGLVLLLLAMLTPAAAAASAMPVEMPAPPLPGVLFTGPVVLEDVHVEVRCRRTHLMNDSSSCEVWATATVHALEPAEVTLPDAGAQATIGGVPTIGTRTLATDARVEIGLTFERALTVAEHDADSPWIITGNRARHIFLGETTSTRRSGDMASGVLFDGAQLRVEGPIDVDASGADVVSVHVSAIEVDGRAAVVVERPSLDLSIESPGGPNPFVQHGGPYLAAGIWGPLEGEGRFGMRAGYELALVDHLILGFAFETDFDAIAESVLVEIASPELAIIIPSFSAGVGAVFRQLGNRDADAALRLHLGYQIFAIGAFVDFDYWPAISDWTICAGGRLSF